MRTIILLLAISCAMSCMDKTYIDPNTEKVPIIDLSEGSSSQFAGDSIHTTPHTCTCLNVVDFSGSDVRDELSEEVVEWNTHFSNISTMQVDYLKVTQQKISLDSISSDYHTSQSVFRQVRKHEVVGCINVGIFTSTDLLRFHSADSKEESLDLGMTPIVRDLINYQSWSPKLDWVFVSDSGLKGSSTLVHELGHFYGLGHPSEHTLEEMKQLGIATYDQFCRNFMSRNCGTFEFTEEQKNIVAFNIVTSRHYLNNQR